MRKRPLVIAGLLAIVAAAIALLLRAWRLLRAPRTETDVRADSSGHGAEPLSPHRGPSLESEATAAPSADEQPESCGVGDLLHRCYEITLPTVALDREALLLAIQQHMTELAPATLADFEKTTGDAQRMDVGDEYEITMLGPWNGRVRVSELTPASFTLVTLEGHPEAGHITFSVLGADDAQHAMHVRIESWARSRSTVVQVAYDALGVGKQVQTEVWITFLQRVALMAGVADAPEVHVSTVRHESEPATDDVTHG